MARSHRQYDLRKKRSGIFLQAGLDRANQLETTEEFSLNAQAFGTWKTRDTILTQSTIATRFSRG
jgi:hypothetical protein